MNTVGRIREWTSDPINFTTPLNKDIILALCDVVEGAEKVNHWLNEQVDGCLDGVTHADRLEYDAGILLSLWDRIAFDTFSSKVNDLLGEEE